MPAPKGHPRYGGRRKGSGNKDTQELRAMILQALDQSGGVAYLTGLAKAQPTAFATLLGKVLPLTVGAPEGGKSVTFTWKVE